jgi:diguanylate cyclase
MEAPGYVNDVLVMGSAIGSAIAGVVCGWQLRGASHGNAGTSATLEADSDAEATSSERVSLDETEVESHERTGTFATETHSPEPANSLVGDVQAVAFERLVDGTSDDNGRESGALYSASEMREVTERLIQMANRLTADVDAHDARLTEVNSSLETGDSQPTMETVMSAVERLMQANEAMQIQLRESRDQIVEQAGQLEKAEKRANTDALTRVWNRRAFDRGLADWTGETPGVLALLDIDYFKKFNDQFGHRAGDEVLRSVANTLWSRIAGKGLVARYGGEEFGLVFTNHELDDVLPLIEEARRAIAESETRFEDKSFRVTCSLGVTRMLSGEPAQEWLQRADDALYVSKDAGRDCGHCIDSPIVGQRQAAFRLTLPEKVIPKIAESASVAKKVESVSRDAQGRQTINMTVRDRIPNCASLSESYRELLQRLGKAPVKLTVIAISVTEAEKIVAQSETFGAITRLSRLLDVVQGACRAVDRIGYFNDHTLLLCMPSIDEASADERMDQLTEVACNQLQLERSELSVGMAELKVGDSFESLAARSVSNAQSMLVESHR